MNIFHRKWEFIESVMEKVSCRTKINTQQNYLNHGAHAVLKLDVNIRYYEHSCIPISI